MIDERLKKDLELEESRQAMMKRAQQKSEEDKARAAERRGKREKKTAKADKKWEEATKYADQIIARGQEGYDTFVSAMNQVVSLCRKINVAIGANNPIISVLDKGFEMGLGIAQAKKTQREMRQATEYNETDPIKRAEKAKELDVKLPDLQHLVQFNEDNTLNVESLSKNFHRTDGKDFTPAQQNLFKGGVIAWLRSHGYQSRQEGSNVFFVNQDNERLTKAEFERLRDDPDHGLNTFLSGHFDMNFKQAPSPSP